MIDIANPGADEAELEAALRALMTRTHSGCKVRKSADQTAADYTTQPVVTWDAEFYDNGGWHDNVTNNSRLTVPSGVARVDISCRIDINNGTVGGFGLIGLRKNGTQICTNRNYFASADCIFNLSVIDLSVTAGDYFDVSFYINNDSSVTFNGGAAGDASTFQIVAVG